MKKTTVGLMCVMVFLVAHSSWAASKYFSYDAGTNLWDTSSAFWGTSSGGPYNATWSSNDAAFFEGASVTVSLVGAQTANSITFLAAGYVIAGSSLTLTPPALVSNAVDAVISSVIAGSAGLAKSG